MGYTYTHGNPSPMGRPISKWHVVERDASGQQHNRDKRQDAVQADRAHGGHRSESAQLLSARACSARKPRITDDVGDSWRWGDKGH